MGDIIQFKPGEESFLERSCGECGGRRFSWYTSDSDEQRQVLQCEDCGEHYAMYGEELYDQ